MPGGINTTTQKLDKREQRKTNYRNEKNQKRKNQQNKNKETEMRRKTTVRIFLSNKLTKLHSKRPVHDLEREDLRRKLNLF